ncbi:MAG TPA: RNase adapter RapZ [Ferruginibacter sp.]|nr:RNase adapter RapZ [Ferruginibacter sp.]
MSSIVEEIESLFRSHSNASILTVVKLPQSGSDRVYFRITCAGYNDEPHSVIATSNKNVKENHTFINFSRHFKNEGAPVPEIFSVNDKATLYLQQDFGDESLLSMLEKHGHNEYVYSLYKKSLKALAHLQVKADAALDYNWCITSKEFGKQAIMNDLLYFKYYFLDTLKIPYDKEAIINDFDALSTYLSHVDHKYFMFRDFQSRNIMIQEEEVFFIDYQGGMKGALQYDVASLLWQAKADLDDEWKKSLLEYYIDCVDELLEKEIDRDRFVGQYNGYVLLRLLQVLGAYGFRGLFERKAHFLTSIPLALRNLKWFLHNMKLGISLPEFDQLLGLIVDDEVVKRFEPVKANRNTPLVVKITSFSYLKRGYPPDETTNGGGFVFDCRGILNPGRIEMYKAITGRDKEVKDYLEQQTRMEEFLINVFNVVDIAVENYIERGFENLMVSFGCTGGQHRSVYAADAMARHVRNKYGVKTRLCHLEQNITEVKESPFEA